MIDKTHGGKTAALILAFLFLVSATGPLFGADGELKPLDVELLGQGKMESVEVARIEVEGLKKTKRRVLDSLILIEEGEPLTEKRVVDTQQNLKKTGLFQSIGFAYREEGERYTVRILLKEKATLIPLPFFSASDGAYSFGMVLFDSNFLGLRKQLITSAIVSDGNPSGTLGLIDPTLADSTMRGVIFMSGGRNKSEAAYPDGSNYRVYSSTDARVTGALTFRTQKKLMPGISFKYEQSEVDEAWEDSLDPPDSSAVASPGISLTYENTYFLEYFYEGIVLRTAYAYAFELNGSYSGEGGDGSGIIGNAEWASAFFGDHRFSIDAAAGYSEFPIPNLDSLSGPGFRVLPFRRAVARSYWAGSAGYEFPFSRPDWGTLTLSGFFDGGVYEPEEGNFESFYGPGGGFRLYLSKVAIPAVGVNFAVDLPTETLQTSIVIGMRM